MKNNNLVLFLDSGVGGISILTQAKKLLNGLNFVFVADFLNSPYGQKSKKEIKKIVLENTSKFCEQFSPKCVVLACNTATAVALKDVRKKFENLEIVGTEPAILPALKQGFGRVLVLCTRATKNHSNLLKLYKNNSKLLFFCPKKLAKLVDENFLNLQNLNDYIKKILKKFEGKIDSVVLGCTHYVFLKQQIYDFLKVPVFDGNEAIAKQIAKKVSSTNEKYCKIKFVSTDKEKQNFITKVGNFALKNFS